MRFALASNAATSPAAALHGLGIATGTFGVARAPTSCAAAAEISGPGKRDPRFSKTSGFTLIELVITLAIVGLLASVALPLYEISVTRFKESELRQALRTIRSALDAYKAATDAGQLPKAAGESGYPPSLDVLTKALDMANKRDFGSNATAASQRIVILRQLPRDPFFPDPLVPAAQTWYTRAYASRADDPQPGDDVFDISSKSSRIALDGTAYKDW